MVRLESIYIVLFDANVYDLLGPPNKFNTPNLMFRLVKIFELMFAVKTYALSKKLIVPVLVWLKVTILLAVAGVVF